jgi:hypothetical protein
MTEKFPHYFMCKQEYLLLPLLFHIFFKVLVKANRIKKHLSWIGRHNCPCTHIWYNFIYRKSNVKGNIRDNKQIVQGIVLLCICNGESENNIKIIVPL